MVGNTNTSFHSFQPLLQRAHEPNFLQGSRPELVQEQAHFFQGLLANSGNVGQGNRCTFRICAL
jgi:hypothetical protein